MSPSFRALAAAARLTPYWLGRRWNAASIARYQTAKIRSLACRAGREIPFYRKLYADAGVDPHLITTLADVFRLPVVTKQHIQSAGAALLAP